MLSQLCECVKVLWGLNFPSHTLQHVSLSFSTLHMPTYMNPLIPKKTVHRFSMPREFNGVQRQQMQRSYHWSDTLVIFLDIRVSGRFHWQHTERGLFPGKNDDVTCCQLWWALQPQAMRSRSEWATVWHFWTLFNLNWFLGPMAGLPWWGISLADILVAHSSTFHVAWSQELGNSLLVLLNKHLNHVRRVRSIGWPLVAAVDHMDREANIPRYQNPFWNPKDRTPAMKIFSLKKIMHIFNLLDFTST